MSEQGRLRAQQKMILKALKSISEDNNYFATHDYNFLRDLADLPKVLALSSLREGKVSLDGYFVNVMTKLFEKQSLYECEIEWALRVVEKTHELLSDSFCEDNERLQLLDEAKKRFSQFVELTANDRIQRLTLLSDKNVRKGHILALVANNGELSKVRLFVGGEILSNWDEYHFIFTEYVYLFECMWLLHVDYLEAEERLLMLELIRKIWISLSSKEKLLILSSYRVLQLADCLAGKCQDVKVRKVLREVKDLVISDETLENEDTHIMD